MQQKEEKVTTNSRKFFIGASMFSWFISSAAFHLNGDGYWANLVTVRFLLFTFLGMIFISVLMGIAWYELFVFLTSKRNFPPTDLQIIHKWTKFRELLKLACLMSVFAIAHISYNFFYSL